MNARHGAVIGVVSSLFTLLLVFTILTSSGAALAQKGGPPDPAAADENSPAAVQSPEAQDENGGGGPFTLVPEEVVPNAVTDYVHVPGSVFVPLHSSSGVEYSPWGCTYFTGPDDATNFALTLPHGSTVTYLRLYYYDTSATYNGTMNFAQYDDGANGSYLETMATSGSAGAGNTTLSGLNHAIDNVNYSYVLYWQGQADAGSTLRLCGMRVGFTPPIGRVSLIPASLYNAQP